jgi:hypothetical protein
MRPSAKERASMARAFVRPDGCSDIATARPNQLASPDIPEIVDRHLEEVSNHILVVEP